MLGVWELATMAYKGLLSLSKLDIAIEFNLRDCSYWLWLLPEVIRIAIFAASGTSNQSFGVTLTVRDEGWTLVRQWILALERGWGELGICNIRAVIRHTVTLHRVVLTPILLSWWWVWRWASSICHHRLRRSLTQAMLCNVLWLTWLAMLLPITSAWENLLIGLAAGKVTYARGCESLTVRVGSRNKKAVFWFLRIRRPTWLHLLVNRVLEIHL